jgi:hypothetical protein
MATGVHGAVNSMTDDGRKSIERRVYDASAHCLERCKIRQRFNFAKNI